MTLKSRRVAILSLVLVIGAIAGSAPSASALQFPTARQIAMHQGTLHAAPASPSQPQAASNPGFDWGDAVIGAGAAIAITATVLGAIVVGSRRHRALRRTGTA
jgi:hypothetical protein